MPLAPPAFSPLVLLTLVVIVVGSAVTFSLLVRRATSHRQWVALSDWARDHGFRFTRVAPEQPPSPFHLLQNTTAVTRLSLSKGATTFLQVEAASAGNTASGADRRILWNLIVREIESEWLPTGLRPTNATASVLDLFSLASFPTLGSTDRFVAFGTDSSAARVVSKSMLRSLLPADVGLLLIGRQLILDFSDRPFDSIEFGRMMSLTDQLVKHLPAPRTATDR